MFPGLYLGSNCGTTLAGGRHGQRGYSSVRRTMETHRAVIAEDAAQPPRRSPMDRQSSGARGQLVGVEIRRPLARSACRVSEPFNVLASTETLVRGRDVAAHLASVPGAIGCPRPIAMGRGIHRWDVLSGEKRGSDIGKTKRGKGSKCMVVGDGKGVPLGVSLSSASPAEIRLAPEALKTVAVPRLAGGRPRQRMVRLIADRAYDGDGFRQYLAQRGIELICPHRKGRSRPATQDGRALRRYRHRWKIERTIAWLGHFRHLVVRYERLTSIFLAFLYFACALIVLRRL